MYNLHLPVEFEGFLAGDDGFDESIEGVDEIGTLLLEDEETICVPAAMFLRGVAALGFFARVKELQGEDGETIEHHAWRLRVQRAGA